MKTPFTIKFFVIRINPYSQIFIKKNIKEKEKKKFSLNLKNLLSLNRDGAYVSFYKRGEIMKELQNQFQLEIGNFQNLKGNAVVYWTVSDPEKKLNPPIQILAVNFAISIFPLDYNLVTATFPPVAFENREEFMLYIRHAQCDLIYAGEFSIKKEMENLKNLPDKEYYLLNSILDSYLTLFREKLDHLILSLSLKENLS